MPRVFILFSLAVFPLSVAYGQEEDRETAGIQSSSIIDGSSSEELNEPIFKSTYPLINVSAGNYKENKDSQLVNQETEYAVAISASADFYRPHYLGLDIELLSFSQNYDTQLAPPLFGTIDNNTSIDTTALLVGLRGYYPLESRLNIYAVAGLGYYRTLMKVRGSTFGLPGELEDTDTSIEFYYGAGASYMFGNWGISLSYRHVTLNSSFGDFNVSNADLGGDMYLVGWRYNWSQ